MENNIQKKSIPLSVTVMVLLVVVVAIYFYFNTSQSQNQQMSQSVNNTTTSEAADDFELKRILFFKYTEAGIVDGETLYSTDSGGNSIINLSDMLGLSTYTSVVTNKDVSKIAYVIESDSSIAIWKANSDGSDAQSVFKTNNTGCNYVDIRDVSMDGRAIIFSYLPYRSSEMGGPCVTDVKPDRTYGGLFYLQDGSEERYFSEESYATINISLLGFYNNDILWATWSGYTPLSVWIFRPETRKSEKLFDIPQSVSWSCYTNMFVAPASHKAVFQLGSTEDCAGVSKSEIVLFDYETNKMETVGSGTWAEYQGVKISPNLDHFIYQRQIHNQERPSSPIHFDFYTYSVKDKKSTLLPFSGSGYGRQLTVLWKDNNSFIYRFPLEQGLSETTNARAMLFNLLDFKSAALFDLVAEIVESRSSPHYNYR